MGYLYDYENADGKKIPYDDIPISRNNNSGSQRRTNKNFSVNRYRIFAVLAVVLFIANIVLCITSVYYFKHAKVKEVNIYNNSIYANNENETSFLNATYVANKSAICVSAGGTCYDESSFFSSTKSHGAGVIYKIDESAKTIYFVTCYHVIEGYEDKIWVLLSSQHKPIQVTKVSYSSYYDVAVLKYAKSDYENYLDDCDEIDYYDSAYLSLGDGVFAVGNPLSGGFSVTKGIVSRLNTMIQIQNNNYLSREIQTDATINPGNSGGGLFNYEGKFVGLVNAKLDAVEKGNKVTTISGTAYAIPGSLVCSIADSIIRNNGKASYINLGVGFKIDEDLGVTREMVSYDGSQKYVYRDYVRVSSIDKGSIAYNALHADDLIESIECKVYENGQEVNKTIKMYNKYSYEDYSFAIVKNSEMKFHIKRDNKDKVITIYATDSTNINW